MSRVSKTIKVTDLITKVKKENLTLYIYFRTSSSRYKLSRVKVDVYFDGKCIKSFYPVVVHRSAHTNEFPIKAIISLKHVNYGGHSVRVALTGLGSLAGLPDSKEVVFDYHPSVKVPIAKEEPKVRRPEVPSVTIITEETKKLYEKIRESRKKELRARRET